MRIGDAYVTVFNKLQWTDLHVTCLHLSVLKTCFQMREQIGTGRACTVWAAEANGQQLAVKVTLAVPA